MDSKIANAHKPVLLKTALEYLQPRIGGKYLDATLGGGGYSNEIYKQGGRVLSLDWDPAIIRFVKEHYNCPNASWHLRMANFANLALICREENYLPVDGVVFDLGLSKMHYQLFKRGFSFHDETILDMRLNPNIAMTAVDIIKQLNLEELASSLRRLVQEKYAEEIARKLKEAVHRGDLTADKIADEVASVYQEKGVETKSHPATKTFLALRILVNKEGENLRKGLIAAISVLAKGGRLVIVSFHSGEDRLVKMFFRRQEKQGILKILTKQPIYPSTQEKKKNYLSRSARLRVAERI